MSTKTILSWLYLANATILITHQIDAACWHEWDLFGMPGGIRFNLRLNIPLVMLMLFGQQRLTQGYADGFVFSWLLVGGIIAVSLHSYFLLQVMMLLLFWVKVCRFLAQQLLQDKGRSIAEVSTEAGFGNQSHMTTVFRRVLQTTPKQYREAKGLPGNWISIG